MPVPLPKGTKFPVLDGWEKLRLTEAELPAHFGNGSNIGLILGEPSGALVDADLDCDEAIELGSQYLPTTPAKTGRPSAVDSHWWYYAEVAKTRQFRDPLTKKMIVELRSTGGQTVVGPSVHPEGEQYTILTGDPAPVPGPMLEACIEALYQAVVRKRYPDGVPKPKKKKTTTATGPRPQSADLLERRAIAYLDKTPAAIGGQGGHNQTYVAAVALVHGFCLSPDHALQLLLGQYNPRCQPPWTEKELLHKVEDAAAKPHDKSYGWLRDSAPDPPPEAGDVDISALMPATRRRAEGPTDPGPMPEEMLRIPGFINEVMDHCLDTAPYPSLVMAFCGALSLQSFLAARKIRDPGDNRTNIYLLGLAHSSSGKDHPRKINTRIVHEIGFASCLGERFASGEGIQDSLFVTPAMLFQTDEIDGILQSINKAKDARHENIMSTLLTMYSAASSVYPMRRKAGKESPGVIDQPSLTIFGTAIPNHYYEALSERMLTNGFFARMVIIEAGPRSEGQEPRIIDLPPRVLETARWWVRFEPGERRGNLQHIHPIPAVVEYADDAMQLLIEKRREAEAEYAKAEANGDPVGTTVWGRVSEQTRKLSLLYAVSENHGSPRISADAVRWASGFVTHQTRRMLFMAQGHVADNPFHAECLKFLRKLREAPDRKLSHSIILKRMKMDAKTFRDLTETLLQRGEIAADQVTTAGRTGIVYRLLEE